MRDAIVIGAGPAGGAAALLLARAGWNVTIIEQHRFPRDKVCGESLGAMGVEVLDRLGLLEPLLQRGAVWIRKANIYCTDGQSVNLDLPRAMLGISRQLLDSFLLDEARKAGAIIRQPARCESIKSDARAASVAVRDLQTNSTETIHASYAFVADGKSALALGRPKSTQLLGIKSHWTGYSGERDTIDLFGCDGCYGGFAPIEDGRWNSAYSISAARLRQCGGDIEKLFEQMLREQPRLRWKIAGATRISPWIASPLPRFGVRPNWPPGVIPIGNAAAAVDPIGGEGMALGLRSAELAAEAVMNGGRSFQAHGLRRQYQRIWRGPRIFCRIGALVASSPRFGPACFSLLAGNEALIRGIFTAIGK
jgi:flavin-dependent dehydrogenase